MPFADQLPRSLTPTAFLNPGAAFRPVVMWLWNDDIDPATLRAQIADMAAKGIGGFFIHPMPDSFRKGDFVEGIKQPYPGPAFFRWVELAAETAREHGLFCWLYDEGGWPSGTVTGTLAQGKPDLAGCVLRVQRPDQPAPDQLGETVATLPSPGGPLRFYLSREGYPTDLLNPAVTKAYLDTVHEGYRARLGKDFGSLVPGVFTDEASVGGAMGGDRLPWTPDLPKVFKRRKGYDLLPLLPALFGDAAIPAGLREPLTPDQQARVRCDFGDVWTQLHADAFYGKMHDWCRRRGLMLVGHVGGEDNLENHAIRLFGHFFRVMRHLDIPGVDTIWRQLFPGQPRQHFSKLASSAAHLEGKRLALSESFAVYGGGLTFRTMKWVTNRQFGDGINLMSPMALHYSSSRGRVFCTMSNLGWGNPMWPLFKGYSDYVGRLAYMLRLGRPTARTAVLYPAASLWAGDSAATVERFHAVTDLLQEAQLDFDYIDEDTLARASVKDGSLRVADQAYEALVLPGAAVLPWAVADRLSQWNRQGGAVIAVDVRPRLCAEEKYQARFDAIMETLFGSQASRSFLLPPGSREQLPAAVANRVSRDFVLEAPNADIRYSHRIAGSRHLYFIVNASEKEQAVKADLAGSGSPEIWDPDRGTIAPVAGERRGHAVRVNLNLPPLGALFLVLRQGGQQVKRARLNVPAGQPIEGPWEMAPTRACSLVQAEPREELVLPGCEAWRPVELKPLAELGLADFSGSVAYRCQFDVTAKAAGGRAWLDLGQVRHAAEVEVNGRRAGVRLWPPYTVEVTGLLRPGVNELRVTVTNTWANQFLQPEEIAFAREKDWYNVYAQRVEPFSRESLESGLLGPVRLEL